MRLRDVAPLILMVVLGGSGTLYGPIIGAEAAHKVLLGWRRALQGAGDSSRAGDADGAPIASGEPARA